MKILVTGGAGYIGSTLVPRLLAQGHEVTVVDRFFFGDLSLAHVCHDPKFEVVRGDARDLALLKPLVAKADVVVPLAAVVGAPACDKDPLQATSTNRDAITGLVKMLSKQQRILYPNTNSGYGVGEKDACTEESPLKPVSLYGRDKVASEETVLAHGAGISFRLATVFGMAPRMRLDLLVNDFVYRACMDRAVVLFEAHFRRNFIHVSDVARAFEHGLERFDAMRGKAYNVGLDSANLSKLQLCEKIKQYVPGFVFMEAKIGEDPDKRDYIVSNARLAATGFAPRTTLDDGIRELIKGCRMLRNTKHGNV